MGAFQFQHLILLGEAYQLTGDEKYANEFKKQVLGWIESNPPKRGVNWASHNGCRHKSCKLACCMGVFKVCLLAMILF